MYVVSLTSAGMATGLVETNKNVNFAYFPIHHARRLVKRGVNWKKDKASYAGNMKDGKGSRIGDMKGVPTKPQKKGW